MILTTEQLAILAHAVVDPQAWADHAAAVGGEEVVTAKIEKFREQYLDEKDAPGYMTRAQREAASVIPPSPAEVIRQQLAALDAAYPISQRNLRDLTLAVAQIIEAVTGLPAADNRGVKAVTAVEAAAAPLREQLKLIEKGLV